MTEFLIIGGGLLALVFVAVMYGKSKAANKELKSKVSVARKQQKIASNRPRTVKKARERLKKGL